MIIVSPLIRLALKIASVVIFLITLFSAYGGYANPEYMTLPSVAVLALPYLAILTFVIGIAWLISGRYIMAGLAGATLVACWGPSLKDASPLSFSKSPGEGNQTFTLMTYNCLHLADTTDSQRPGNRAIEFLTGSGADIICLQELVDIENKREIHHWDRQLIDSLYAAYPYRAGSWDSDLKVFSKYPVKEIRDKTVPKTPYSTKSNGQRWRLYEVDINGFRLPIVNFHLASYRLTDTEREVVTEISGVRTAKKSYKEFRKEIFPKMGVAFRARAMGVKELIDDTEGITPLIACGDFNDVAGGWAYRQMRKGGFQDAYSETAFGPTNTFNQFMFLFHIDQIFYRGKQLRALKTRRLKINTSDHYPVEATFEITH